MTRDMDAQQTLPKSQQRVSAIINEDARLRNFEDVTIHRYPHIFNSQPLFTIPSIDEVLHISRRERPTRPPLKCQCDSAMSIPESFTEQDLLPFHFDEAPRSRHRNNCIAVSIYNAMEQAYSDAMRQDESMLPPAYSARTTYETLACQTESPPQTLADLADQYQGLHRCNSWDSLSSRNSTANLYTIREEPEPPESNMHLPILHFSKLAMVRRRPVVSRKPLTKLRSR